MNGFVQDVIYQVKVYINIFIGKKKKSTKPRSQNDNNYIPPSDKKRKNDLQRVYLLLFISLQQNV